MARLHKILSKTQSFSARAGDVLLEAALTAGVTYPHDCRVGRCGSCLTRVQKGITLGGESAQPGMVFACQARVLSDLHIELEDLPEPVRVKAVLERVTDVAADVVELEIATLTPFSPWPGQYCRFTFQGFPARAYSPTAPMASKPRADRFRLHIKRVRNGRVSTQFGTGIVAGHKLQIEGPYGSAFHRPGRSERLVLAAAGTGFAPIYSVADAALRENYRREMVLVVGARKIEQLYMPVALGRLSAAPNVTVIATTDEPQELSRLVRSGSVAEHVPPIRANDLVYAAGGPRLVSEVTALAATAQARVYCDVFDANGSANDNGGLQWIWSKFGQGRMPSAG